MQLCYGSVSFRIRLPFSLYLAGVATANATEINQSLSFLLCQAIECCGFRAASDVQLKTHLHTCEIHTYAALLVMKHAKPLAKLRNI